MKKFKKVFAITLALALVLGSMGNVFAYPLNNVNYDGIQVNDTFYSLGYITSHEGTFGDTFGPADRTKVILDFNQKAAKFSNYLAANPADFDAWASTPANQTPANPTKFVKADGTIVDITPTPTEITVVGTPVALNRTTIEVTFSNDVTQNFTVSALSVGANTRVIRYSNKDFTVHVNYNPSPAKVENIQFINYRNVKVTFDEVVDHASATNAANYYFEIVDGNAGLFGAMPDFPTLQRSNQLSEIETDYIGGADGWWNGVYGADHVLLAEPNIVAKDVNGKTVVDIYLPEDARFTNVEDRFLGTYPDGYDAADAERTLAVEMRDSKTDGYITKLLTQDTVVNVAVRNVKDTNGQLTIDTAVMPIRLLDTVKPELLSVDKVEKGKCVERPQALAGLQRDLGSFDLLRSKPIVDQVGEELQFTYSEPVFDAHRMDMSDLDYFRDLTLYVNGKKVASLSDGNLKNFMHFEMGKDGVYNDARLVTLDVERAVWAAYDEVVATGKYYTIRFVGVTDLAGNIEVSSEHSFNVKFYDDPVVNPNPVTPEVKGVVQVADNIFRVEFNREDVKGKFVIENPDGEGYGVLKVDIPRSAESDNGKFYSYVAVPARDHEPIDAIPTGTNQEEILAYDGQDEIYRNIRVENIYVCDRYDEIADYTLRGDDFIPEDPMTIVDDILAPVALNVDDMDYGDNHKLVIPVEDITPWVEDENAAPYWVSPIAYEYDAQALRFKNEIRLQQQDSDYFLPILVSYEDSKGAIHEAVVTNYDVKPEHGAPSDLNEGYKGSIDWDPNDLILDLSFYPELLDSEGNLVEGATYKVDLPKGYFTDSPKDNNIWVGAKEFGFDDYTLDMLYVDDGRDDDNYFWIFKLDSGLGYTSDAKTVYANVLETPAPDPDPEYVPQTSKQLIYYDEARNSMRVEFTGTIDVSTLKDKNNYSIDGKTLAQWDAELGTNTIIKYVVDNSDEDNIHQYAEFVIPQDSIQEFGNYAFTVSGVSHPDGGTMTPVETEVALQDNFRPVVIEAKVTGDSQIMLTFNEPLKYFVDEENTDAHAVAKNFIVMVGDVQWDIDTAVLPTGEDNDREIILNGTKLPTAGDITVEIVRDQNNNILVIDKSPLKNLLNEAVYDVVRP